MSRAKSSGARKGAALVVYATTEGHTAKVGHFVANLIAEAGFKVDVYNAADLPRRFTATGYDRIVVAASLHAGRHQHAIAAFLRKQAANLAKARGLFISVSLAAAGDAAEKKDALALARKFVAGTSWNPGVILSVAGALKFTEYDFFRRWIMKRIARDHGIAADGVADLEFTDWPALERAVLKFVNGA